MQNVYVLIRIDETAYIRIDEAAYRLETEIKSLGVFESLIEAQNELTTNINLEYEHIKEKESELEEPYIGETEGDLLGDDWRILYKIDKVNFHTANAK